METEAIVPVHSARYTRRRKTNRNRPMVLITLRCRPMVPERVVRG